MRTSLSPVIEQSSVEQSSRLLSPTQIRLSPLEAANLAKIPDLVLPSPALPTSSNTGEFDTLHDLEDVAAEASFEIPNPSLGDILNHIQRQMAHARAQNPQDSGINELAVDMVSLVIEELVHMRDDESIVIEQERKIGLLEEHARACDSALARKENITRRQAITIAEQKRIIREQEARLHQLTDAETASQKTPESEYEKDFDHRLESLESSDHPLEL